MARDVKDQCVGGTLTIPDGCFVSMVNLDADEPCCMICRESTGDTIRLAIPRALAYYLTTHDIGSKESRERIQRDARNELRRKFKDLLRIEFL